jgi:hypothetical protein
MQKGVDSCSEAGGKLVGIVRRYETTDANRSRNLHCFPQIRRDSNSRPFH